jgi:hypothetical protein
VCGPGLLRPWAGLGMEGDGGSVELRIEGCRGCGDDITNDSGHRPVVGSGKTRQRLIGR